MAITRGCPWSAIDGPELSMASLGFINPWLPSTAFACHRLQGSSVPRAHVGLCSCLLHYWSLLGHCPQWTSLVMGYRHYDSVPRFSPPFGAKALAHLFGGVFAVCAPYAHPTRYFYD